LNVSVHASPLPVFSGRGIEVADEDIEDIDDGLPGNLLD